MSLSLFVVRHAIAVERSLGRADADRALTEEGRARFAREVAGLSVLGLGLDRVLHSPWLRARETAEMLAPLLEPGAAIEVEDELARAPRPALLDRLGEGRVAVVGHEPWLSDLIAWLVSGDPGHGAAFELKKGAVAQLEGRPRPGAMELRALLPPKVLRRLGDGASSPD